MGLLDPRLSDRTLVFGYMICLCSLGQRICLLCCTSSFVSKTVLAKPVQLYRGVYESGWLFGQGVLLPFIYNDCRNKGTTSRVARAKDLVTLASLKTGVCQSCTRVSCNICSAFRSGNQSNQIQQKHASSIVSWHTCHTTISAFPVRKVALDSCTPLSFLRNFHCMHLNRVCDGARSWLFWTSVILVRLFVIFSSTLCDVVFNAHDVAFARLSC